MKKVYRAIYKTDYIYAEGFLVFQEDHTIEGIFATDYMYIYNLDRNTYLFLRSLYFESFSEPNNGYYNFQRHNEEYISSRKALSSNSICVFFNPNNNNNILLQIQEEILDSEEIKCILLDIVNIKSF